METKLVRTPEDVQMLHLARFPVRIETETGEACTVRRHVRFDISPYILYSIQYDDGDVTGDLVQHVVKGEIIKALFQ